MLLQFWMTCLAREFSDNKFVIPKKKISDSEALGAESQAQGYQVGCVLSTSVI